MSRLLDLESIFKVATSGGNQNADLNNTLGILFEKVSQGFRMELARVSRERSEDFIKSIYKEESVTEEDLRSFGNFIYHLSLHTLKAILYRCIADEVKRKSNLDQGANDDRITALFSEKFSSYSNFKPNTTDNVIMRESVTHLLGPVGFGDQIVRPILQKYNTQINQDIISKISDINKEIFKSVVTPGWNSAVNEPETSKIISFIVDSLCRSFKQKYFSSEETTPEVFQRPTPLASSTQQVQQEAEVSSDNPYQSEFRVDDHHIADSEYRSELNNEDKVKKIATLTTQKLEKISERACDDFINRLSGNLSDSDGRIIYEKFSNVMVAVIVCSSIAEYFGEDVDGVESLYDFFNKRNYLNTDPFLFLKDAIIAYTSEDPSYYDGAFTLRNFKFFERYVAMGTDRFLTVGDEYYMNNVKNLLGLFQVNYYNPNPDLSNGYIFSNGLIENQEQLNEIKKMKFRFRALKNLRDKATNKVIDVFNRISDDQ